MPSKERNAVLCRALVNAALDQPHPTQELVEATQHLLTAVEHSHRLQLKAPACACIVDPLSPLQPDGPNSLCPIHGLAAND